MFDNFNEELGKVLREQEKQEELAELDKLIGQELMELLNDINKEQEIRNGLTNN